MTAQTAVQNFEQRYTLYQHIALYCAIAAGVFLVITVLLFLILRIPQVLGELTGRTARKAVQEMTEKNPGSGRLQVTGLDVKEEKNAKLLRGKAETENETMILMGDEQMTIAIHNNGEKTVVKKGLSEGKKFKIRRSIVEIHTQEVM